MSKPVSQHEPSGLPGTSHPPKISSDGQRGMLKSLMAVWLVRYVCIPVAMSVVAASGAAIMQSAEASGRQYHVLVDNWPRLSAQLKREVADELADGKISRWESVVLDRKVLDELGAMEMNLAERDVHVEKGKLINLVQIAGLAH